MISCSPHSCRYLTEMYTSYEAWLPRLTFAMDALDRVRAALPYLKTNPALNRRPSGMCIVIV